MLLSLAVVQGGTITSEPSTHSELMRSICNAIHYLKLKVLFFWALTEIPATDFYFGLDSAFPWNKQNYWLCLEQENRRQGHTRCIWRFTQLHNLPSPTVIQHWTPWASHCGGLHCHPSAPSQTMLCQYLYGSCATCIPPGRKLGGTHPIRREPRDLMSQLVV